ncbi:glycosyltransferase [Legionella sp. WA2022007384]
MNIILFDIQFMQSKKWAIYHGGGENDYTVLLAVLNAIGNKSNWKVYGHYVQGAAFTHDINFLESTYSNFKLVSDKDLDDLRKKELFAGIYSSGIEGLQWVYRRQLQSKHTMIVIHGIRRYELTVHFKDIFLPNRPRDKVFILKNYFMRYFMRRTIVKNYQQLFAQKPEHVKLVATSHDTRDKLIALCPQLKTLGIETLYTSAKTLVPNKDMLSLANQQRVLKKYNLEAGAYFLLVSLGRIEKNVYFALENLYRLLKEHDLPLKIFACGETKNNFLVNRFKKSSHVVITGYISADELAILYKNAFVFVYPTRSEGFGMPVLEAMEHGTPVCCTALSSLIEVGGMAAEYFSLGNQVEFCAKILRLYHDREFYQHKRQLSLNRFQYLKELQEIDLKKKITKLLSEGHN